MVSRRYFLDVCEAWYRKSIPEPAVMSTKLAASSFCGADVDEAPALLVAIKNIAETNKAKIPQETSGTRVCCRVFEKQRGLTF